MNEKEFTKQLLRKLQEGLKNKGVKVQEKSNLIYKISIDENLSFVPNKPHKPKRGDYAFQTDLLIVKKGNNTPLVVIEIKYNGFSTHDILTYSAKAQKHKEIYPYLRYGLVVGKSDKIHNRFFTHNTGFDFAYVLNSIADTKSIKELVKIVKQQIDNAFLLLNIVKKDRIKKFNTILNID